MVLLIESRLKREDRKRERRDRLTFCTTDRLALAWRDWPTGTKRAPWQILTDSRRSGVRLCSGRVAAFARGRSRSRRALRAASHRFCNDRPPSIPRGCGLVVVGNQAWQLLANRDADRAQMTGQQPR